MKCVALFPQLDYCGRKRTLRQKWVINPVTLTKLSRALFYLGVFILIQCKYSFPPGLFLEKEPVIRAVFGGWVVTLLSIKALNQFLQYVVNLAFILENFQ